VYDSRGDVLFFGVSDNHTLRRAAFGSVLRGSKHCYLMGTFIIGALVLKHVSVWEVSTS
jgi:hypothetical protein